MQPGARLQAAIDVLSEIVGHGRAVSVILADWSKTHRFAGSNDRAWIGNLVYDALRRKASLSFLMQSDSPRALALAALRYSWGMASQDVSLLCSGEGQAPSALTPEERERLAGGGLDEAPLWVRGDYPEWLQPSFADAFGDDAPAEGRALAERAPLDLRVNTLKATREKVLKALARHEAFETSFSPIGLRLPPRQGGRRIPNVEAEPAHARGWFEVQDEGSQIAAVLSGAEPRMQVADICAGAGGKTLAMAAQMRNTGQIYAYDADPIRFRPLFDRLKRAGARNVQALPPGQDSALDALVGRVDLVFVDAPCSGSGAWRRRPDAKWRLTRAQLEARLHTQRALLERAAALARPGGIIAYVTCSVLPEENDTQIAAFLAQTPGFSLVSLAERAERLLTRPPVSAHRGGHSLLLTPAQHGTDGFYIALMEKRRQ